MDDSGVKQVSSPTALKSRSGKARACEPCRRRKSRCIVERPGEACLFCRLRNSSCKMNYDDAAGASGPQREGSRKRRRMDEEQKTSSSHTLSSAIVESDDGAPRVGGYTPAVDKSTSKEGDASGIHIVGPLATADNVVVEGSIGARDSGYSYAGIQQGSAMTIRSTDPGKPILYRVVNRRRPGQIVATVVGDKQLDVIQNVIRRRNFPHLIDGYFRTLHPAFPILDEETFRRSAVPGQLNSALVCSLCAATALYWRRLPALRDTPMPDLAFMWNSAAESVTDDFQAPSLDTVLAAIIDLLGRPIYSLIDRELKRGKVVALAHSLGLNKDCTKWDIPPRDKCLRKRIWWGLMIADSWWSLSHGTPPLLRVAYNDVGLPTIADIPTGTRDVHSRRAAECFISLCRLTAILQDALPHIYNMQSREVAASDEKLNICQAALDDFFDTLPTWLTSSWAKREALVTGALNLQMSYFAVKLTLARLRLRTSKETATDSRLSKDHDERVQDCQAAAMEIANLVNTLTHEDAHGFWLPFTAYHLSMTVTVLLRCAAETSGLTQRRTSVEACQTTLRKLRALRDDAGWDLGDICISQCDEVVDRASRALLGVPSEQGGGVEAVVDAAGDDMTSLDPDDMAELFGGDPEGFPWLWDGVNFVADG